MIKLPPTQLITAPNENTAQSIAIDNEKIIALKRYLTEFISNPTDRVLIFCNNGKDKRRGYEIGSQIAQMGGSDFPLGCCTEGMGIIVEKDLEQNYIDVDNFLNTTEGNNNTFVSTLVVDNGAGKFYVALLLKSL